MRVLKLVLLTLVTLGLGLLGAWIVARTDTVTWFLAAGVLHVAAAFVSYLAAWFRSPELSQGELDMVLVLSVFIPVIGPSLAWWIPHKQDGEVVRNAHVANDVVQPHEEMRASIYRRGLMSEDLKKSLALHLDVQSFGEIMHRGTDPQRLRAIRALCELGGERHHALIRSVLAHESEEMRLFAYAELNRKAREHEDRIHECQKACEESKGWEARCELARAHLDYACSGIQDESFSRYEFHKAYETGTEALKRGGGDDPELGATFVRACIGVGAFQRARSYLNGVSASSPQLLAAALELAFVQRDFKGVRQELVRIEDREQLPEWVRVFEPGQEVAA